jgi:hypothetical protein
MLSQNRIKINSSLRRYILNSINNSIDKKCKLFLDKETTETNNLFYKNNILSKNTTSNNNISGFIFFLSLSAIHFIFSNKK